MKKLLLCIAFASALATASAQSANSQPASKVPDSFTIVMPAAKWKIVQSALQHSLSLLQQEYNETFIAIGEQANAQLPKDSTRHTPKPTADIQKPK